MQNLKTYNKYLGVNVNQIKQQSMGDWKVTPFYVSFSVVRPLNLWKKADDRVITTIIDSKCVLIAELCKIVDSFSTEKRARIASLLCGVWFWRFNVGKALKKAETRFLAQKQ